MMRLLIFAFVIALAPDPAHAPPLFAAVGALFGAIGGAITAGAGLLAATTIWGTIARLALTLGASLLANLLRKKPTGGSTQPPGMSLKLNSGGRVPRAFGVGEGYATRGSLVYANTWQGASSSTPNNFFSAVYALADLPGHELVGLVMDGVPATYDKDATPETNGIIIPEFTVGGVNYLWVRFYDGTQVAADTLMTSKFSSHPERPYGSDRVGEGICYAVVTARLQPNDVELFVGYPKPLFVMDGLELYDVRNDTTAGGSGAERYATPATWSRRSDPVTVIYNTLRGIRYAGAWAWGGQSIDEYALPFDSWSAAATECDTLINLDGGGTEPQFRVSGEIGFDMEPADVIEELLNSGLGKFAEIGGQYKVRFGAPGASIASFTDDTIIVTSEQVYRPFPGMADTYNGIVGRHVSINEAYDLADAPPIFNAANEVKDGDRRLIAEATFYMVTSGTQAQRLMKASLQDHRRFASHVLPLPPSMLHLEPLDVVSFTSDRNGYVAKKFEVISGEDEPNLFAVRALREIDPTDYDWVPATDEQDITFGTIDTVRPPSVTISGWGAVGITITGDGGRQTVGCRLSWDIPVDDVEGIQFQIRLDSDESIVTEGSAAVHAAGQVDISGNLVSLTVYEARGRYIPISDRIEAYSSWIQFTTPDVRVSFDDLADAIDDILTGAGVGSVAEAKAAAERLALQATNEALDLKHILDRQAETALDALFKFKRVDEIFSEISVEQTDGRYRIKGLDQSIIDQGTVNTEVLFQLDLNEAEILLRATTIYVDDSFSSALAAIEPFAVYPFTDDVNGWTATNGNLVSFTGFVELTATSDAAGIKKTGISFSGTTYPIIRVRLRRTTGSSWLGKLQWDIDDGGGFAQEVSFSEPGTPGDFTSISLDLRQVADWGGETIIGIAFELCDDTEVFEIDRVEIAKFSSFDDSIEDLEARITVAEIDIDGAEADILLRATSAELLVVSGAHSGTLAEAEIDIDAAEADILARVLETTFDDLEARVTVAEVDISARDGTITFLVQEARGARLEDASTGQAGLAGLFELMNSRSFTWNEAASVRQTMEVRTDALTGSVATLTSVVAINFNTNAASIVAEQIARADGDTAQASSTTVLAARVTVTETDIAGHVTDIAANVADIVTEQNTRASADTALASDVTTITARTDAGTAEGRIRFQAGSAPTGSAARWDLQLSASEGGTYYDAGISVDLLTGSGSRIRLNADLIEFDNGNSPISSFSIEGGVVRIANAIIDAAYIEDLTVGTGKLANNAVTDLDTNIPSVPIAVGSLATWTMSTTTSIAISADGGILTGHFDLVVTTAASGFMGVRMRLQTKQGAGAWTTVREKETGNVAIPQTFEFSGGFAFTPTPSQTFHLRLQLTNQFTGGKTSSISLAQILTTYHKK